MYPDYLEHVGDLNAAHALMQLDQRLEWLESAMAAEVRYSQADIDERSAALTLEQCALLGVSREEWEGEQ